jgi:hypothetical protein
MAEADDIKQKITETSTIVENTLKSIASQIGDIFQDALSEADGITKIFGKDVEKQLKSLARSTDNMIDNQIKINAGQLSSKNITKQILEYQTKREILEKRINNLSSEQPELYKQLISQLKDVDSANNDYIKRLKEQEKQLTNIENRMGVLGKLAKGLSKIPILGNLIEADKVEIEMKKAAANGKSPFIAGFKEIGKSITSNLLDPLTLVTFILNESLKADKQTTEIAKSLSLTKTEAAGVREQFVSFSTSISDTSITTDRLVESFSKLSKIVGFNVPLSKSLLKEFTTLTKNIGISEESAAGLGKITLATGKDARSVTTEALETAQALQSQNGIQLDNREVLEDIGKVSGQLLANFKANPSAIAAAVTQAKLLGTNLETVKKQGESLLNFESSIQSELEAELLTNRALNLEKARAAALSGDQVTVMKELNSQNIDFNKFSNMNVLAQQSLAQALGLSADELSDQLLKQQMMGKSRAEIVALGGEEAAKRLEALSAQDKFNNTVEKLKDIIGNLVAGPFGQLLEVVSNILSSSTGLYTTLALIGGISLGRTIASLSLMAVQLAAAGVGAITLSSALTLGLGIAAIVAGIAVAMGAFSNANNEATAFATGGIVMSEINNATVGEAGPEAIIPLNSSTGRNILGGNNNGNSELLSAINDMKNIISNQKLNITLQNQNNIERSGTAIREYSYKLS